MPPKLPDFANISERLRKALRLEHRIVVIGLSDTPPANLPHYEGEPLKACQMLDTVRFEGKSFYTVQNDHYECTNAIRWLGYGRLSRQRACLVPGSRFFPQNV